MKETTEQVKGYITRKFYLLTVGNKSGRMMYIPTVRCFNDLDNPSRTLLIRYTHYVRCLLFVTV